MVDRGVRRRRRSSFPIIQHHCWQGMSVFATKRDVAIIIIIIYMVDRNLGFFCISDLFRVYRLYIYFTLTRAIAGEKWKGKRDYLACGGNVYLAGHLFFTSWMCRKRKRGGEHFMSSHEQALSGGTEQGLLMSLYTALVLSILLFAWPSCRSTTVNKSDSDTQFANLIDHWNLSGRLSHESDASLCRGYAINGPGAGLRFT